MKIYFTLYLIPVVVAALLVFWLALRNERVKLIFLIVLSGLLYFSKKKVWSAVH